MPRDYAGEAMELETTERDYFHNPEEFPRGRDLSHRARLALMGQPATTESKVIDIRSCPKCQDIGWASFSVGQGWYVQCDNCGPPPAIWYSTEASAIKHWNSRERQEGTT